GRIMPGGVVDRRIAPMACAHAADARTQAYHAAMIIVGLGGAHDPMRRFAPWPCMLALPREPSGRAVMLFRSDHAQPFGFAVSAPLAAPEPNLHAVEIKIDHGRRVERQQLAQREPADHGVAERLAQLRAGAVAERER